MLQVKLACVKMLSTYIISKHCWDSLLSMSWTCGALFQETCHRRRNPGQGKGNEVTSICSSERSTSTVSPQALPSCSHSTSHPEKPSPPHTCPCFFKHVSLFLAAMRKEAAWVLAEGCFEVQGAQLKAGESSSQFLRCVLAGELNPVAWQRSRKSQGFQGGISEKQAVQREPVCRCREQVLLEFFFNLAHREIQPSTLSLSRGEKSRVSRLLMATIRSDKWHERDSHSHQMTPLTARVTMAIGSLQIATRGAADTSPLTAPLPPPSLEPAPGALAQHRLCFHGVQASPASCCLR